MKKLEQFKQIFEKVKPQMLELYNFDIDTCKHSISVALLAFEFMQKNSNEQISAEKLENITIAALLHDIGKLDCPSELIKGGAFKNEEDRQKVQDHAIFTKKRLEKMRDSGQYSFINQEIIDAAADHHETENGVGYPFNKTSKDISYFAKILHIVDVYEALLSERTYKKGFSEEYTLGLILNDTGEKDGIVNSGMENNKFDANLLKKFIYMTSCLDLVNSHVIANSFIAELDPDIVFKMDLDELVKKQEIVDFSKTYNEDTKLQEMSFQSIFAYRFMMDKELIETLGVGNAVKIEKQGNEKGGLDNKRILFKALKKQLEKSITDINNSKIKTENLQKNNMEKISVNLYHK